MKNLNEKPITAAERFLDRRGYETLDTNWETPDGFGTVDIIAVDEDTIVFIDVEATRGTDVSPTRRAPEASTRPSLPSGSRRTWTEVTRPSDSTPSR